MQQRWSNRTTLPEYQQHRNPYQFSFFGAHNNVKTSLCSGACEVHDCLRTPFHPFGRLQRHSQWRPKTLCVISFVWMTSLVCVDDVTFTESRWMPLLSKSWHAVNKRWEKGDINNIGWVEEKMGWFCHSSPVVLPFSPRRCASRRKWHHDWRLVAKSAHLFLNPSNII